MASKKKGIFYDAAQTVEDMRKLISWFRIEDCRTDMVRFGNECCPSSGGGCAEYGHFSRYSCQNQYYRSGDFPAAA